MSIRLLYGYILSSLKHYLLFLLSLLVKFKQCGHSCIGLCGEPCPEKCRVCNKEEVTQVFFGTEDEPEARFVQLDCGHVVEVSGLDHWMDGDFSSGDDQSVSIQPKKCPMCKSLILRTQRYGNVIRRIFKDIEKVSNAIREIKIFFTTNAKRTIGILLSHDVHFRVIHKYAS